ncbi:hypothetical protein K439DRAFT_599255 [Ramaria rubella]|nr:hypothetical protein K439DRAFT_599255 [Ramaria rubella]
MSLRTGSFQNRFYPGGSPGQSLGPIDMPDVKHCIVGSFENDASTWLKALQGDPAVHEDDFYRNHVSCGIALPNLHALVNHFDSCHVEVLRSPYDDPEHDPGTAFPPRPTPTPSRAPQQQEHPAHPTPPPHRPWIFPSRPPARLPRSSSATPHMATAMAVGAGIATAPAPSCPRPQAGAQAPSSPSASHPPPPPPPHPH